MQLDWVRLGFTVTVPPTVKVTASRKEVESLLACAQQSAGQGKRKVRDTTPQLLTYTNAAVGGLRTKALWQFAVGGRGSVPATQATGSYGDVFNATVSCSR